MVNVVVPRNSVQGVISAALTAKELQREGRKAKTVFVDEKRKVDFWNNLPKYSDEADKSLIILDMPHAELHEIKEMKLEPWQVIALYIPSELNAPNREERDALVERGVSVVPTRRTFECFLGDMSGNESWTNLSRILSMEESSENVDNDELKVARGIAETAIKSPKETIRRILKEDVNYFRKLGSRRHAKPDSVVKTPDNQVLFVTLKATYPKVFADAFATHLKSNVDPVAIHGQVSAIFTTKPTFFTSSSPERSFNFLARFGKGAVIGFRKEMDPKAIAYFAGWSHSPLLLRISSPRFFSEKTLQRRLVGGKTSQEVEGKTYEKMYHGLGERHPGLRFLTNDIILVPSEAFEETVALLHEGGSSYELLSREMKLESPRTSSLSHVSR